MRTLHMMHEAFTRIAPMRQSPLESDAHHCHTILQMEFLMEYTFQSLVLILTQRHERYTPTIDTDARFLREGLHDNPMGSCCHLLE